MTSEKPRKLRPSELDDWFDNDVTKQFFLHLDADYDSLMNSRLSGGFYHPGEPFKTQEGFAFTAGMERTLLEMRDRAHVRERLTEGFAEDEDGE
jgi:hypothetical protein